MKIKVLENDLHKLNSDFENFELIYQNSSFRFYLIFCKNFESIQKKVLYLVNIVKIIAKVKSNLENVLASQKFVFGKCGLGFNSKRKNRDVWLDKEDSSADSSSSKTKIEVCLMQKEESGSNHVSTSSSNKCESYFQLLDAF